MPELPLRRSNYFVIRSLPMQFGLAVLVILHSSVGQAGRKKASPVQPAADKLRGRCSKQDTEVKNAFSAAIAGRHQIRALVMRFADEDTSETFGSQVGGSLRSALNEYARQALHSETSGLSAADLHVRYVDCIICIGPP